MIDLQTTTKQFLNVYEVMELLDVSRRTVYYWTKSGQVEHIVVGGTVRISVSYLRDRVKKVDPAKPTHSFSRSVQRVTDSHHAA